MVTRRPTPKKCREAVIKSVRVELLVKVWLPEGERDRWVEVTRSCGHRYNWSGPADELPEVGARGMRCIGPDARSSASKRDLDARPNKLGWVRYQLGTQLVAPDPEG